MKRSLSGILVVIGSTCVTVGIGSASADDVKFRYNKHELETRFGIEQLYQRIERRAENACTTSGRRALWQISVEAQCTALLKDDIVQLIDDPQLALAHSRTITLAREM